MRGSSACRLRPTRAKTSKSLSGTSANRSLLTGALLGVATFAVYMIGSNRSFGYDAAATIANFVATPSLWDAFAVRSVIPTIPVTQVAGNDHVLVSLLSHVIYSATGSRNEVVYRLLPAFGGGATVGLSTGVLVRRFGLLAGLCAGLYIATDPLFVDNSRDLRGYSLAALGSVAGTVLLAGPRTRWRLVGYAVVMGLALAAHLFAAVVLLCHLTWILTRRSRAQLVELAPAWIGAALIGLAANASVLVTELVRHGLPPPLFYPAFPRDLLLFLLGAPVLLPVGLWLAVALLGLWVVRKEAWLWAAVERIHSSGGRACVIHSDEQVLAGYTTGFTVVTRPDQLADCDAVVVVSWGVDLGLRDEAAREFPKLTTLDAYYPAVVLVR